MVVEKSYVEYTHPRQISLWLVQFELETILKIIELSCCPFGDDRADIYGDALALDGLGMVYEVNLHFGVTKGLLLVYTWGRRWHHPTQSRVFCY